MTRLYALAKGILAGLILVAAGWISMAMLESAFPEEPCLDYWNEATRVQFECDMSPTDTENG